MKKTGILAVCMAALAVSACTDAGWEKLTAYGDAARVTCHSGGVVVFDDFSTGKVQQSDQSDPFFKSATTGRLVEVSGDCRIDYGAKQRPDWKPVYPQ